MKTKCNIYDPSIYPSTHLTLPPSIQFVYLYVRMGLILYWGETTQGETTHGRNDPPNKSETTHPKNKGETTQGETTHGRNDPRAKRPGFVLPCSSLHRHTILCSFICRCKITSVMLKLFSFAGASWK